MENLDDRLHIKGHGDATLLAGELFVESFGVPFPTPRDACGLPIPTPPENWRQYVATYRWPTDGDETVGFCNWIRHGDVYLEGGMCVRNNFYRRLPKEHFRECAARGGLAYMMMEAASHDLDDCVAWFGYCGDAKALAVDLRFGYEKTHQPMLIVKWFREIDPSEQRVLIDSIARIGPF